ncbi:hypothetical protein GYMLUDRAFT_55711 [Collybiopsis luxurians FD-317 M1]|nr:hypothetical protein GYMLUDRAFT_55711 [Collybiopsis luxurians FD-317 M1]
MILNRFKHKDDIWDCIYCHKAKRCVQAAHQREEVQLAEEHCEAAKSQEAAQHQAAAVQAKSGADRKREHEDCLKSLWHAMSHTTADSTLTSTDSLLLTHSSSLITLPANVPSLEPLSSSPPTASSSPSMSPSKWSATDDSPSTPSPTK